MAEEQLSTAHFSNMKINFVDLLHFFFFDSFIIIQARVALWKKERERGKTTRKNLFLLGTRPDKHKKFVRLLVSRIKSHSLLPFCVFCVCFPSTSSSSGMLSSNTHIAYKLFSHEMRWWREKVENKKFYFRCWLLIVESRTLGISSWTWIMRSFFANLLALTRRQFIVLSEISLAGISSYDYDGESSISDWHGILVAMLSFLSRSIHLTFKHFDNNYTQQHRRTRLKVNTTTARAGPLVEHISELSLLLFSLLYQNNYLSTSFTFQFVSVRAISRMSKFCN